MAKKPSPFKIPWMAISTGISAISSKRQAKKQRAAMRNMQRRHDATIKEYEGKFEDLDYSNPYSGLVNTFEDMANPYDKAINPYTGMQNVYSDMGNVYADIQDPFANLQSTYEGMANQFEGMENVYDGRTNV